MPYLDAVEIINAVCQWLFSTPISGNLDLISFVLFVICIGWVIYSLGNKEA